MAAKIQPTGSSSVLDCVLRQPRRYSRKALATRFADIDALEALQLFAFEEALDGCDATPYGLPHEWYTVDSCSIMHEYDCIGMLDEGAAILVAEARRIYQGAGAGKHLFLRLGRTGCRRVAVACELVATSPPRGERLVCATPGTIAHQHRWITPTQMLTLSSFLDECTSDVLLADHWSDVPYPMGMDLAVVDPKGVADRICANLLPVRIRLERTHKTRSQVVIALQKTEGATILWYGAVTDARGTDAKAATAPPEPFASINSRMAPSSVALVQLPASRRIPDDPHGGTMAAPTGAGLPRLLVVDRQEPRDCAALLGLYPDVSPDGLAIVFEIDRTLCRPRQWWSAKSAAERLAGAAHGSAASQLKHIGVSKRNVKDTALAICDAIRQYSDRHNDQGIVTVLWARPSSDKDHCVTISYVLATTTRAATIDPDALALAAASDYGHPATLVESAAEDKGQKGARDGDDDVPPLEPIPHDVFDLVRLYPSLTGAQVAALSRVAESLKRHSICFAWLPAGLAAPDHTQRVKTTRWGADWAAQCIVNTYCGEAVPASMIEIGVVQRQDGDVDLKYTLVERF
nr:hypothetical protein [Pandoravirus massiliensis]